MGFCFLSYSINFWFLILNSGLSRHTWNFISNCGKVHWNSYGNHYQVCDKLQIDMFTLNYNFSLGMVKVVRYITSLHGGTERLSSYCQQRNLTLNLGAAPLICFLPFKRPIPTKKSLSLIKWGPIFLLCVKVTTLSVDLIYLAFDYHQSGWYLDVDNIHYILFIPSGT